MIELEQLLQEYGFTVPTVPVNEYSRSVQNMTQNSSDSELEYHLNHTDSLYLFVLSARNLAYRRRVDVLIRNERFIRTVEFFGRADQYDNAFQTPVFVEVSACLGALDCEGVVNVLWAGGYTIYDTFPYVPVQLLYAAHLISFNSKPRSNEVKYAVAQNIVSPLSQDTWRKWYEAGTGFGSWDYRGRLVKIDGLDKFVQVLSNPDYVGLPNSWKVELINNL